MIIYGVYEDDEYEECVFVGTIHEIAKEFNKKESNLRACIYRNKRFVASERGKYIILKLYKEEKEIHE